MSNIDTRGYVNGIDPHDSEGPYLAGAEKSCFEAWQKQFDLIGGIRGLGAMLGLELVKGENREPAADEAKQLTAYCLEKGLILLSCGSYGNIIRVLVPFVITDEQLEKGFGIIEEGLSQISS